MPLTHFFYLQDRLRRAGLGVRNWTRITREARELAQVDASLHWYLPMARRRYSRDARRRGPQPFSSSLNNVLWNGLRQEGLPEILHSEDALSMAFSIESRTPFLDHRLVEFCFSLPFYEKISDGWTKSLLRRSMAGVVAPEILARRAKYGFGAPVTPWLRLEHNARAVRELLLDPCSLQRGLFPARRLELALKAFHRGPPNYARFLVTRVWRWVTLELWFREFVDGAAL
jgi:asparagine synthase (glutamine-hydrolysing)